MMNGKSAKLVALTLAFLTVTGLSVAQFASEDAQKRAETLQSIDSPDLEGNNDVRGDIIEKNDSSNEEDEDLKQEIKQIAEERTEEVSKNAATGKATESSGILGAIFDAFF